MLRVGIIGLGGIANSHCRGIAALEDVKVVAVADLMEERRREFMAQYDIPKGYATHTELLADPEIDAVGGGAGAHAAPPADRGCLPGRQARAGGEADGHQYGAVR